jgi:hypothetical protein
VLSAVEIQCWWRPRLQCRLKHRYRCHLAFLSVATNRWLLCKDRIKTNWQASGRLWFLSQAVSVRVVRKFHRRFIWCHQKLNGVTWCRMFRWLYDRQTTVKLQGKMEVQTIIIWYWLFIYDLNGVAIPFTVGPVQFEESSEWFTGNST